MLEFRRSLPAYKEKDAVLAAISQNQVSHNCIFLFLLSCFTCSQGVLPNFSRAVVYESLHVRISSLVEMARLFFS